MLLSLVARLFKKFFNTIGQEGSFRIFPEIGIERSYDVSFRPNRNNLRISGPNFGDNIYTPLFIDKSIL